MPAKILDKQVWKYAVKFGPALIPDNVYGNRWIECCDVRYNGLRVIHFLLASYNHVPSGSNRGKTVMALWVSIHRPLRMKFTAVRP